MMKSVLIVPRLLWRHYVLTMLAALMAACWWFVRAVERGPLD